jgi:hypothetical protein
LVIDANTPLASALAAQGFQAVARWRAKVAEHLGAVQHLQFPLGNHGNRPESAGTSALEQCLRILALKALDHDPSI